MSATLTATGLLHEKTTFAPRRVLSMDVLRGITIAFMILVNDPGDWSHLFSPLDHAEWNGWTMTDLVFPTFLFLVGVAMVYSFAARSAKGDCRKTLTGHIFLRTGKLLLLSFVLVYFPRMHWSTLRFYGVIPRIAVCSLLAGLILVATIKPRSQWKAIAVISAVLLIGYWILLRWVPVPGAGLPGRDVPFMDPNQNLTSCVDREVVAWTQRLLHTGSLYKRTRDPEGLLSTLPAVATVLLGSLTAMWMRAKRDERRMQVWLAAAGLAAFLAGELWSLWFPINKNLWTSSYVLLTAGLAAMALAALSLLVDRREQSWPMWLQVTTWPWFVFGANAIAAYTTSVVLVKGALYFKVGTPSVSVWGWIYAHLFARQSSTVWTSLSFAIVFVLLCFLPNWFLWRRKWFWKM